MRTHWRQPASGDEATRWQGGGHPWTMKPHAGSASAILKPRERPFQMLARVCSTEGKAEAVTCSWWLLRKSYLQTSSQERANLQTREAGRTILEFLCLGILRIVMVEGCWSSCDASTPLGRGRLGVRPFNGCSLLKRAALACFQST